MPIFVNKEEVVDDIIQQELQMLLQRYRQEMTPEELQEKQSEIQEDAKQNAIERMILTQQAREEIDDIPEEEIESRFEDLKAQHGGKEEIEKNFDLTPEVEKQIKGRIADGIKLDRYFDEKTRDIETPTEEECRENYEAHRDDFRHPEMVRAAHIVRQPAQGQSEPELLADMMNTREQILKGASFEDLANSRSQCDDEGGDLGWFPRGEMVPQFEEAVFNMQPGEISDVFQTEFGHHIVKLLERREAETPEFEEVRYEIENRLLEERKNQLIGEIVDELRKDAEIEEVTEAGEEQAG